MREQELAKDSEGYFWPVVFAVGMHALLFALLFVSYSSAPDLPPATPIIKARLYQLESQSNATTPTQQKIAGEAEKTKAPLTETEQLELKKAEQDKQVAAAKAKEDERKAQEAKRAEEAKKAEDAKKAEEAKKADDAKAAKLKAEQEAAKLKAEQEAKKKAEEEAKRKQAEEKRKTEEAKRKAQAEAKRKAEAEAKRKRDKEAAERKALEDRKAAALAEMMGEDVQYQQTTAQTQGNQIAGSIDDLIRRLVNEAWIIPPSARKNMRLSLRISMLPDGTIANVSLLSSSGDKAVDNSAISAVKSVRRIPEIQQLDRATFDRLYRQRDFTFSPEGAQL
ncbi:cell envelope integrity protein TolA [Pseudomonas sp. F1_0610]|uniref:cell envelope integrity protein TolA n=1 Tax=Pseudomonas sp. F1_0610 TaxID=3114284 RepID=UPI0039C2C037